MAATGDDQKQSFWTTVLQSFRICFGEPVIPEHPINKDSSSTTTSEESLDDSEKVDDEKKYVCESIICEEPMQQARPSIVLEYDSAPLSAIPEEDEEEGEEDEEEPTSERGSSPLPPSLMKLKRSSRRWSSTSDLDSIKSSEVAHPREFE